MVEPPGIVNSTGTFLSGGKASNAVCGPGASPFAETRTSNSALPGPRLRRVNVTQRSLGFGSGIPEGLITTIFWAGTPPGEYENIRDAGLKSITADGTSRSTRTVCEGKTRFAVWRPDPSPSVETSTRNSALPEPALRRVNLTQPSLGFGSGISSEPVTVIVCANGLAPGLYAKLSFSGVILIAG